MAGQVARESNGSLKEHVSKRPTHERPGRPPPPPCFRRVNDRLEPLQQRHAVASDAVKLRRMRVRIDKPRNDQPPRPADKRRNIGGRLASQFKFNDPPRFDTNPPRRRRRIGIHEQQAVNEHERGLSGRGVETTLEAMESGFGVVQAAVRFLLGSPAALIVPRLHLGVTWTGQVAYARPARIQSIPFVNLCRERIGLAMSTAAKGLEGVVAAETEMSFIDGAKGVLEYVGIAIDPLARHSTFEETVFLLWNKRLPKSDELASFNKSLRANYALGDKTKALIEQMPTSAQPMHVLRTIVSSLALEDSDPNSTDLDNVRDKGLRILAQAPAIVAAFDRRRRGLDLIEPDASLSFASNFLWMLNGEKPTSTMERAFDACMILHADHGLNASTFACRVIISTLSDIYSAITGAIGALRGPLHGGANEGVMVMLNDVGSVADVEPFVMGKLERKERIMGFGHRVYKAYDPRATYLKTLAKKLAEDTGNADLYEKSHKVEQVMEREVAAKGIYPNVDFYSATTYHSIGLKLDLFTPMFALSRIAGWTGHALEQLEANRLIRPKADYVGPHDQPYVPMDER